MNSLQSGHHSRRSSDTSQISVTSGSSFCNNDNDNSSSTTTGSGSNNQLEQTSEEDLWTTWAKIIHEWEQASAKKKLPQIKVIN